jgi:hypothetical protein
MARTQYTQQPSNIKSAVINPTPKPHRRSPPGLTGCYPNLLHPNAKLLLQIAAGHYFTQPFEEFFESHSAHIAVLAIADRNLLCLRFAIPNH